MTQLALKILRINCPEIAWNATRNLFTILGAIFIFSYFATAGVWLIIPYIFFSGGLWLCFYHGERLYRERRLVNFSYDDPKPFWRK